MKTTQVMKLKSKQNGLYFRKLRWKAALEFYLN